VTVLGVNPYSLAAKATLGLATGEGGTLNNGEGHSPLPGRAVEGVY
jgi:hypothetical protein